MAEMFETQDQQNLRHVYSQIAPDIPEDYESDEHAEVLIDAGRLEMHGFPETQKAVRKAIDDHGYETVLMEIARIVI